jgi:DivIVA domain-containing protein
VSDDVTAALDNLSRQVTALSDQTIGLVGQPTPRHADAKRLTPADVHDTVFTCSRLIPGYATEQVDVFLARVAGEIETLIRERDEARARLAALQGEQRPHTADGG